MNRRHRLPLRKSAILCAGLFLIAGTVARAQGGQSSPLPSPSDSPLPAGVSTAEVPDVQIVAMPNPMGAGQWIVTAAYPTAVDRTKAAARVRDLVSATGWSASAPRIEDRALQAGVDNGVLKRHHMEPVAPAPSMTSVTFSMMGALADPGAGTLAVEPFIRAYRDLSRLRILFLVPGGFSYRGPRVYSDPKLDLAVSGGNGAFMYVIAIRDHDLRDLHLPRTEADRQQALTQVADEHLGRSRRLGIVMVFVIALVAAVAVYLGMRYGGGPRSG